MEYRLRPAHVSDAAGIARLSEALGYPAESDEIGRRLESLLPDPRHLVLVAEAADGSSMVAWLAAEKRMTLESGIIFEIVGLIVGEQARRLGIGRALVQAAERWVVDLSGDGLRVRSNVLRHESHGFYESLGFTRTKSQHVYRKRLGQRVDERATGNVSDASIR